MILLDTNVLARMTTTSHPQCAEARGAIQLLFARAEQIAIVPQNLYEFWAVATRSIGPPPSGQNGLGLTTNQTSQWLRYFQRRFKLLFDKEDLLTLWHNLVTTFNITGAKSHDVRLVASMQSHGITQLMTFNSGHFRPFPITLIDPGSM